MFYLPKKVTLSLLHWAIMSNPSRSKVKFNQRASSYIEAYEREREEAMYKINLHRFSYACVGFACTDIYKDTN